MHTIDTPRSVVIRVRPCMRSCTSLLLSTPPSPVSSFFGSRRRGLCDVFRRVGPLVCGRYIRFRSFGKGSVAMVAKRVFYPQKWCVWGIVGPCCVYRKSAAFSLPGTRAVECFFCVRVAKRCCGDCGAFSTASDWAKRTRKACHTFVVYTKTDLVVSPRKW